MTQRSELGIEGEEFAAEFLKRKGYKILGRNKREKWGELDIVARAPDKTLVFVEVKTMMPGTLKPEDQMSASKMKKFRRTAELYAGSHEDLIKDKRGWRLDLIALEKNDGGFTVRHYENV
ncbi:MAG: YraN family protein [Minisyncoccia bacterium]|jgi:putative endonuclease